MNEKQRDDARKYRRLRKLPKHSPPHFEYQGENQFLISGACYEHAHFIGKTPERMMECEEELLKELKQFSSEIYAWCILPNHYHVLLKTSAIKLLIKGIGLFNGRTSYQWNGQDDSRGRKVWNNCFERVIKSERHFYASLNYVLHNPVHHGYVERWQDWPWSNAKDYLESLGKEKALKIWQEYPILDYGKKWDVD